jgi:hypothetical protein
MENGRWVVTWIPIFLVGLTVIDRQWWIYGGSRV